MEFVVYVIKSQASGKIYTGYTSDLKQRLDRHNQVLSSRETSYTHKNKGPWAVVYKEVYNDRQLAKKREAELKSGKGREFLKTFITRP